MSSFDPKKHEEDETEVEITDLDGASETHQNPRRPRTQISSLQVRLGLGIVLLIIIALLVATVLRSLPQVQQNRRVTGLSSHVVYPVSLSVVDDVCYARLTNGTVTAVRIRDGSVLWQHKGGKAGEGSAIVVDGVVYLAPL